MRVKRGGGSVEEEGGKVCVCVLNLKYAVFCFVVVKVEEGFGFVIIENDIS